MRFIILLSLIIFVSGCAGGKKDAPDTLEKDTIDSLDQVVARGAISGEHRLADLVGMSEDGRYWLFQKDRLKNDGNNIELNEEAALTLWDNAGQEVIFNLKGIECASYIPGVFISSSAKKIYFEGDGKILSFAGDSSDLFADLELTQEFDRYKVIGEIGSVLYVKATSEESPEIVIYAITKDKPVQEVEYLKNVNVIDVCEKGFIGIEHKSEDLEKVLLYLVDFDGNKRYIGNMLEADRRCLSGISLLDASVDGRYVLYSVGKTPTSLAVYDTNKNIARVLCLGDGESSELRLRNFWCSGREAMAVLWDTNDKEKTNVVLKKYIM